MMKCGKFLTGSLMLSALAMSPWQQAMASSYFGQFCLALTDPDKEEVVSIGLEQMGDSHIIVSGTVKTFDGVDLIEPRSVSGSIELFDDHWNVSLLSTWMHGNDIYHISLAPDTLMGEFSRMGREFDTVLEVFKSSFVEGDVSETFKCDIIKPDSVCDDLQITAGHLPPPDSCRIWNPALPDGQQRPPFKCDDNIKVPAGTCLINQYGIVVETGG